MLASLWNNSLSDSLLIEFLRWQFCNGLNPKSQCFDTAITLPVI